MLKRIQNEINLVLRDIYYNKICASVLLPNTIRTLFYKAGGVHIENKVTICAHCFVGSSQLSIGRGTFINYNVWFNTAGEIRIGKQCNIAYNVMFVTSTHELGDKERRAGRNDVRGIEVGDGTWIGAGAIILPGVKIGKGVVIGAGSVVTKACDDNCVYAGNPAVKVKDLDRIIKRE